jgi:hypothetical protein
VFVCSNIFPVHIKIEAFEFFAEEVFPGRRPGRPATLENIRILRCHPCRQARGERQRAVIIASVYPGETSTVRRDSIVSNPFFDQPILNSPYVRPVRHWELDADGQPTQKIIETAGVASG